MIDSRLQIAENQEDIAKAFEGVSEDLGYKVKVIYTDPSNSPQLIGVDKNGNTYIKNGTAYVDKDTGVNYILINTESPANRTKAGVIGTIAEEQSHIIGKIEGRQKVVPDGSEKGLESLGRPTNDYFKNEFSKNDKAIGIVSDGKDYSNVDFGENVGDNLDYFEKNQYYNTKGYMKDDGSFKVVVTPKKGESELEAITNGHYKIKKTDDFLYAQEGNNQQIIDELSKEAKIKSIIDPYNNYIVTVSREEGINILAVPKAKSWKENQSKDFHEAVGNLAKSNEKVAENWKNKKYLSAAGNGIISVLSVPSLIQTGAGSTIADLVYSFNPGEVQYGKEKDILRRRANNKAKAKVTTDLLVSIAAASVMPNKIGGGTITVPSTAQAVVATGEVVGAAGKVITLPTLGTGGVQAMLMASGVGSGSNNSEKNNAKVKNDIDNYKGVENKTTTTKTKTDLERDKKINELLRNGKIKEAEKLEKLNWKTDSVKLDKEMQKAGIAKPGYPCAAHHIVTDKMEDVVEIFKEYDIDINSAANGVYLPTKGAKLSEVGKEAIHIGATSKEYRDKITERIIKVVEKANNNNLSKNATKDAILKEINNIRNDLLTGKLKINNAKLKS